MARTVQDHSEERDEDLVRRVEQTLHAEEENPF